MCVCLSLYIKSTSNDNCHTHKWFVLLLCRVFINLCVYKTVKWWDGNKRRHGQSKLKGNYFDQRCPLKGWVCCLLRLNLQYKSDVHGTSLDLTLNCKWHDWCYQENFSFCCYLIKTTTTFWCWTSFALMACKLCRT